MGAALIMDKHDLESNLREFRPGCAMTWANQKSLMVSSFTWPHGGFYEPSFALNLVQTSACDPQFEGLHFATRMKSREPLPMAFGNELNQNIRFVRHAVFDDTDLAVMLDVAEDSSELTPVIFRKYYTFFTMALQRLKDALPVSN